MEMQRQWKDRVFSAVYACPEHSEASLEELSPRMFSFNSPYGACEACDGLGTILEFDPELIVPDGAMSLQEGAVDAWRHQGKRMNIWYNRMIRWFCRSEGVSPSTPWQELPADARKRLMYGDGEDFEGVIPNLTRRWRNTDSEFVKNRLHSFLSEQPCRQCKGARLKPASLAVTVQDKNIHQLTGMTITEALDFIDHLQLDQERTQIATAILREIRHRLTFLADVGLGYITLDRTSATLSGGEAQRIRLATQVGSGLVGVCYVLDEPTIGLHQRDNQRLIRTLKHLRDMGNTVLVVEHDEETIRSADEVIDMGPAAGRHGGRIVAQGGLTEIMAAQESLTGKYLSGAVRIETPSERRAMSLRSAVELRGCSEHNLKNIDVAFPLGGIVCVTGVSGSGKSTLVNETLLAVLRRRLTGSRDRPGAYDKILGIGKIDKVIEIDQSPIGRTPRSNPATYTGVFDLIRQLFAKTREAKIRGYKPGGSASTCAAGGARPARARARRRSRCTSCRMCTWSARSARARGTTGRRLRFATRARTSPTCFRCGSRRRWRSSRASPRFASSCKALNDVGLSMSSWASPHHALGRRGPAREAGRRTGQDRHRPHALCAGRADDRPALCRYPQFAGCAQSSGGHGQHDRGDRAQPRRGQVRRLDHRPWPRGRRRRRRGHRPGHARRDRL